MKKYVFPIVTTLLLSCIVLCGCTEQELLREGLAPAGQDYIVVSIDANVRVNGHPDLWDPVPGVPVELYICKAGGEFHQEVKTTGDNGETGIVHTSFNLYREQPITFTAYYYGNLTYSKTVTLKWDTVEAGANEVGLYSWAPLIILVVEEL